MEHFRHGCPITFSDVQCAHRKVNEINQWLANHNRFKVLITGKMGTGKTTLVKGLKENYVPDEQNLLPHTVHVTPHEYTHNKIDFVFFDTPGLKDAEDGANDYKYLKDMVRNSQEPSLLIFAVKMDDAVLRQEDIDAMKAITNAFGWKMWRHAMFILTFANKVNDPSASVESKQNKVFFNRIRDQFELTVAEVLLDMHVQEDVANNIPVIPVGLVSQPLIPSDSRKVSWLEEFWASAYSRLKSTKQEKAGKKEKEENSPCGWWYWMTFRC